jgi:hypothetical protein
MDPGTGWVERYPFNGIDGSQHRHTLSVAVSFLHDFRNIWSRRFAPVSQPEKQAGGRKMNIQAGLMKLPLFSISSDFRLDRS